MAATVRSLGSGRTESGLQGRVRSTMTPRPTERLAGAIYFFASFRPSSTATPWPRSAAEVVDGTPRVLRSVSAA